MHEARATVQFDLTEIDIPSNAVIEKATLSIYRTHEPKANGQYGYDQDGELYCNPSTVSWSESTEGFRDLWPKIVTAHNEVSGDTVQYRKNTIGWISFDVTDNITAMLSDPITNNGFIIRGKVDSFDVPGKSGLLGGYASAEYQTPPTLRPKLEISYSSDDTVKTFKPKETNSTPQISISENKISLEGLHRSEVTISFLSLTGRELFQTTPTLNQNSITLPYLNKGIVLIRVTGEGVNFTEKVIIQ